MKIRRMKRGGAEKFSIKRNGQRDRFASRMHEKEIQRAGLEGRPGGKQSDREAEVYRPWMSGKGACLRRRDDPLTSRGLSVLGGVGTRTKLSRCRRVSSLPFSTIRFQGGPKGAASTLESCELKKLIKTGVERWRKKKGPAQCCRNKH